MTRYVKILAAIISAILMLYLLMMIPDPNPGEIVNGPKEKPFSWNRDTLWSRLENTFREEKMADPALREARLIQLKGIAENCLAIIENLWLPPGDSVFTTLLDNFFSMAPLVAAGNLYTEWFINYSVRARNSMKAQSCHWNMDSVVARHTIYQVLYGMRAAVEEVLLQSPGMNFDPVMFISEQPSSTPQATLLGITVHSGDLIISRGGAVASALISRGNDYPGNFSHVALICVDEKTAIPYLVEAHIERGVTVSSVVDYAADKKLRFMVMRPRTDLPQLIPDPMIPQKAASYMYHKALASHIPYDFQMNFHDSSAMFCSEVGAAAYRHYGIRLWQTISTISSPGVVRLLHEFGVENFVTMMPSDLEYDPQLAVVAEWRDPQTLLSDHIYNAVMDVMLESADPREEIRINPWMLPVARVVKGYSMLLNLFHAEGPIPEGMSATQGLKNNSFAEIHEQIRKKTEEKVRLFVETYGYFPPYWQLISMVKEQEID